MHLTSHKHCREQVEIVRQHASELAASDGKRRQAVRRNGEFEGKSWPACGLWTDGGLTLVEISPTPT